MEDISGGFSGSFFNKVFKIENNFARGGAVDKKDGGQFAWIAKQTGGIWKIIWQGSDSISCAEARRYGVPVSMYTNMSIFYLQVTNVYRF